MAERNSGSSNGPNSPIENDRSLGPTNSTSMPSTAAICSTASTASGDSICAIPKTRERAFSSACGSVPKRAPRWNSAIPRPVP